MPACGFGEDGIEDSLLGFGRPGSDTGKVESYLADPFSLGQEAKETGQVVGSERCRPERVQAYRDIDVFPSPETGLEAPILIGVFGNGDDPDAGLLRGTEHCYGVVIGADVAVRVE
jgi:hypothetical protein